MTDLDKRVFAILDDECGFNDLPLEEREKILRHTRHQQILTLWQVLEKNKELTTEAWRKKHRAWLKNCVESYERKYMT